MFLTLWYLAVYTMCFFVGVGVLVLIGPKSLKRAFNKYLWGGNESGVN